MDDKAIYWIPRILGLILIVLLFVQSFSSFSLAISFFASLWRFIVANILTVLLLAVLVVALRYEFVGRIGYGLTAVLFLVQLIRSVFTGDWRIALYSLVFAGIAAFTSWLFLMCWKRRMELTALQRQAKR